MRRGGAEPLLTHWEGEPVAVWRTLWSVPALEAWRTLGSTNDRARTLTRAGAEPFTTVLAEEQTAGRGRAGRRWLSPRGGLWMSVVLPPSASGAELPAPLLAGLAVCGAIEGVVEGVRAGVKWPNDIVLNGRKVCGILCEGVGDVVVAGVGLNVAQQPGDFPPELEDSATSVRIEARRSGGPSAPEGGLRAALAGRVISGLRTRFADSGDRLNDEARRELEGRDWLRGREVSVEPGPSGTAAGIDASGALLVRPDGAGEDALVRVIAGSVRLRSARPPPGGDTGSG